MDFNNNKKSFEELLREKVEHHEMPFEANSWSQMQNKLQAHQAQAAATQTTLYKSILLKTGKVLVGVISGSAIVYSTLSLTGMLDKKELADNNGQKHEIVLQKDIKANESAATAGNTAMLNLVENKTAENATHANASNAKSLEQEMAANQHAAANNFTLKAGNSKVKTSAATKHLSANSDMQYEKQNIKKDVIAANNSANSADLATAKNSSKENTVNSNSAGNFSNKQQNKTVVNDAKTDAENPYITVEKNASGNANVTTEKSAVVQEPVAKEEKVIAKADEAKEEITAANVEVDSAMALNNGNAGKYPQKPSVNKPASRIGLIASGGLNANWSRNRENNVLEIMATPMFGLHATMPLSKNITVQAGAQYASYDVKNVSHTSAVVQYAILQDSSVTRTNITQAKYIEIPLLVKYAVHPRINVFTGLRTGLLMGARATVSQELYINKQLASSTPIENGDKFAQFNGLRSVDFGIPFGIEYGLHRRWNLTLNYTHSLSDFTYNSVFDTDTNKGQKDKHSSVQLQVNFKIF
ncbi:MAG: outer membrane beta-barrel protein [Bacteroidia bacterium]